MANEQQTTQQNAPSDPGGHGQEDPTAASAAAIAAGKDPFNLPQLGDDDPPQVIELERGDSRFPGDTEGYNPPPPPAQVKPEDTAQAAAQKSQDAKQLAGKFDSVDELESAHVSLQKVLGRQGTELRQARDEILRLTGRLEAVEQIRKTEPKVDQAQEDFVSKRAKTYQDRIGLEHDEAMEMARQDFELADSVAARRVQAAEQKYEPLFQNAEQFKRAEAAAAQLRDEVDTDGNMVRPDWQDVSRSQEFAELMQANPEYLNSKPGIEALYLKAKSSIQATQQPDHASEAASLKKQANEIVDREKRRAASASGAGGGTVQAQPAAEQVELAQIYGTSTALHPMAGGSW